MLWSLFCVLVVAPLLAVAISMASALFCSLAIQLCTRTPDGKASRREFNVRLITAGIVAELLATVAAATFLPPLAALTSALTVKALFLGVFLMENPTTWIDLQKKFYSFIARTCSTEELEDQLSRLKFESTTTEIELQKLYAQDPVSADDPHPEQARITRYQRQHAWLEARMRILESELARQASPNAFVSPPPQDVVQESEALKDLAKQIADLTALAKLGPDGRVLIERIAALTADLNESSGKLAKEQDLRADLERLIAELDAKHYEILPQAVPPMLRETIVAYGRRIAHREEIARQGLGELSAAQDELARRLAVSNPPSPAEALATADEALAKAREALSASQPKSPS